jgi:hypothetical protein
MDKLMKIIQFLSAVLSIIAIAVSFYSYLSVSRLQQHFEAIKPLEMHITITKPEDRAILFHYVTTLEGQIALKTNAWKGNDQDVNIELAQRNIDIVPLVRPLSEANLWYAQTRPAIRKDGQFQGSMNLGGKEGRGVGVDFQILIIAVPNGTISQGATFRDLPPYGNASSIITVRRAQQ